MKTILVDPREFLISEIYWIPEKILCDIADSCKNMVKEDFDSIPFAIDPHYETYVHDDDCYVALDIDPDNRLTSFKLIVMEQKFRDHVEKALRMYLENLLKEKIENDLRNG